MLLFFKIYLRTIPSPAIYTKLWPRSIFINLYCVRTKNKNKNRFFFFNIKRKCEHLSITNMIGKVFDWQLTVQFTLQQNSPTLILSKSRQLGKHLIIIIIYFIIVSHIKYTLDKTIYIYTVIKESDARPILTYFEKNICAIRHQLCTNIL